MVVCVLSCVFCLGVWPWVVGDCVCICVYVCMCVCVYVCMYVCVCVSAHNADCACAGGRKLAVWARMV